MLQKSKLLIAGLGAFIAMPGFAEDMTMPGSSAGGVDRQVEAPAFLGQVGGREVDGNALDREFELAILQGRTHAVLAFLYFGFG